MRALVPDYLRKPFFLLWTAVVPQVLLLLLNLHGWWLASAEMSESQRNTALGLFAFQLALLAANALAMGVLAALRRTVSWPVCAGSVVLHVAYLWFFMAQGMSAIPASVSLWMLPEQEVMYHQFALVMPAIFHAVLLLAGAGLPLHWGVDLGISLGGLVGVPAIAMLALQVFSRLIRFKTWHQLEPVVFGLFIVAATAVTMLMFLRTLLHLFTWLRRIRFGWLSMSLIAGLACPIGGLLLNRSIPFPYDFQAWEVYAFAVLNGIVLLLPVKPGCPFAGAIRLARVAMYPFTLYFFLVFLPYLPLSLLAMLAAGAGFLILAPTLLFVIHTRRLVDDARTAAATMGWTWVAIGTLAALALLPLGYTARAGLDRRALMAAVDYVFSPDFTRPSPPAFPPGCARRALERLNERKNGIYLPFLSEYYSHLVFGGMVLPDHKMQTIHRALFGKPLEAKRRDVFGMGDLMGRARRARMGGVQPPPRSVALADATVVSAASNDFTRATVTLSLTNGNASVAEYVGELHVPDGVLLAGYWLDVEGRRVPGRVFERKTAQWVYHMIRDVTRRDPGLVVFNGPHSARLSVFPFNAGQKRLTGVEFLFPTGLKPTVRIGDRAVPLEAANVQELTVPLRMAVSKDTDAMVLSGAAIRAAPSVTRRRYPHFLLDVGQGSASDFAGYGARAAMLAIGFPESDECRVTLVNHATYSLPGPAFVKVAELNRALGEASDMLPPEEGGFCPDRAIKSELLAWRDSAAAQAGRVPVFVAIQSRASEATTVGSLSAYAALVPDASYYLTSSTAGLRRVEFETGEVRSVAGPDAPRPVVSPAGGAGICVAADAPSAVTFLPAAAEAGLAHARRLEDGAIYARGLNLWRAWAETEFRPIAVNDALPRVVAESRATGVLTPLTSFIVVENEAQWKTLQLKERQALKADHALEFDEHHEVPAPMALWLAPVALWLLWRKGSGTNRGRGVRTSPAAS
jgi:hypothetical protein